jgi:hypothetical protein
VRATHPIVPKARFGQRLTFGATSTDAGGWFECAQVVRLGPGCLNLVGKGHPPYYSTTRFRTAGYTGMVPKAVAGSTEPFKNCRFRPGALRRPASRADFTSAPDYRRSWVGATHLITQRRGSGRRVIREWYRRLSQGRRNHSRTAVFGPECLRRPASRADFTSAPVYRRIAMRPGCWQAP